MIARWLTDRARLSPARVAIEYCGEETTYAELAARSKRLGRGLPPGERVASLTGNRPEHVELFFACARAGAILAPLSWRLSPYELAQQLDDAEPALLFVEPEHEALARDALSHARVAPELLPLGPESPELLAPSAPGRPPRPDDPLLLVYTSGTTGRAKGALLTHANCFWTNVGFDAATGVTSDDVVLQTLPQFHVGGWNVQPLLALWKGARLVLERGLEPERTLALLERTTTTMGVPTTYLLLAQEPRFAGADLSRLRRAICGGAPMPDAVLAEWRGRGVGITLGYGLTEAGPNVLVEGKPYPYVDVDLRDGELVVRGPNVFAGYWRNDEATRAAFADGWLLTGDVAERDGGGRYRICGRRKDMYISGGENVYPAEVEAALHEHPAVAEAAVVGVPDERWGERGVAFVVASAPVGEEELLAHARERLARFKVPRAIVFVDDLPRSSLGKVRKEELRV